MGKDKKTLRQLRIENRFKQREVSEGASVPFGTYVAYELGYRKPSLAPAKRLARFFGCRVEDIEFELAKKGE